MQLRMKDMDLIPINLFYRFVVEELYGFRLAPYFPVENSFCGLPGIQFPVYFTLHKQRLVILWGKRGIIQQICRNIP